MWSVQILCSSESSRSADSWTLSLIISVLRDPTQDPRRFLLTASLAGGRGRDLFDRAGLPGEDREGKRQRSDMALRTINHFFLPDLGLPLQAAPQGPIPCQAHRCLLHPGPHHLCPATQPGCSHLAGL